MSTLVEIRKLGKQYWRGEQCLTVLSDIDLDIVQGDFMALMGPSGSGKSTLLNMIAGIDRPTSGSLLIGGLNIVELTESELTAWRAAHVGFIFQSYHLMPVLTAFENIELPLLLTGLSRPERKEHVDLVIQMIGLEDRKTHYPSELSGGQQQRVAIARALVTDPDLIVADEPTGDLDRKSAEDILGLLESLNQTLGKTLIMVTHDQRAAERAHYIRHLDKGELDPVREIPAGHKSRVPDSRYD